MWAIGSADGAPPVGLVIDGAEQLLEDRSQHHEALLENILTVNRRLPFDAKKSHVEWSTRAGQSHAADWVGARAESLLNACEHDPQG